MKIFMVKLIKRSLSNNNMKVINLILVVSQILSMCENNLIK